MPVPGWLLGANLLHHVFACLPARLLCDLLQLVLEPLGREHDEAATTLRDEASELRAKLLERHPRGCGELRQLVYYWFDQRGRRMTSDYAAKFYTVWDSIVQGRSSTPWRVEPRRWWGTT